MAITIPTSEPTVVTANDTMQWQRLLAKYPTSDGWAYSYALRGPENIDIDADSDGIVIESAPETAGDYSVQGYATKGTQRFTFYAGTLTVKPDLAAITSATYDGRSTTKIILDALDAMIAGQATKAQKSVQIDTTRIEFMDPASLMKWRSVYATKYWRECNPGKLAPTVKVTFGRF